MATHNRFIKVNGAFFRDTGNGLIAENDPAMLRQLIGGQQASTETPVSQFAGQRTIALPMPPQAAPTAPTMPQGATNAPLSAPAPRSSMDGFNSLMGELLKAAQGVTTADLLKRKRELERESVARSAAPTEERLRTLSPAQQSAIRSGSVNALGPDIDANKYEIAKAEQSIDNFYRTFEVVKKMSDDAAEKMVAPDNIIQNAARVIEADPEKMDKILAGFNQKSREIILGALDYNKLTPKPKAGEGFTLGEGERRFDASGNLIASGGPKTFAPSSGSSSSSGSNTTNPDVAFRATIEAAAGLGSSVYDQKNSLKEMTNLATQGDYESLLKRLEISARNGLTAELRTEVLNAATNVKAGARMAKALQAYQAAGGNMGFLKGTADSIATNLGQLATDPRFKSIATELKAAFQQYRQDMTGAAFGAAESRDYKSVVPSADKSFELNLAVIDGLNNYLTGRINDTYSSVLGEGYTNLKYYVENPSADRGAYGGGGSSTTGNNDPLGVR